MGKTSSRLAGFLFVGAISAAAASLSAQTKAPSGDFNAKYIGEGGAYQQPSAGVGDYLETGSRQQGGNGTFGPIAEAPKAPSADQGPAPLSPMAAAPAPAPEIPPAPSARKLPVSEATSRVPQKEADRGRYSLWGGLSKPLALPKAKIGEVSEDEAMSAGRSDYESHILGLAARPAPNRDSELQGLKDALASHPSAEDSTPKSGEIFVSFDIDLKNHPEQYRDALAGLSSAAGFRPDARFEPRFSGAGTERAAVWGWMPSAMIGAAMQVPNVSRLQIENPSLAPGAARASRSDGVAMADILIGVKLPSSPAGSDEGRKYAVRALTELSSDAGFSWKKTIGYQQAPGSKDMVLIVSGEVPVRALDRVMAHRDVVKISPVPPPAPASLDDLSAEAEQPFARRFLAYVLAHAPFLILTTVVMVAPGVLRVLHVFVPYV